MADKRPGRNRAEQRRSQQAPGGPAVPSGQGGRRHPGLEEAWQSSEKGPGALVAFLAAGAFLLLTVLVAGLTWLASSFDVPVFLALPVVVALLFGGFVLLQRLAKD